MTLAVRLTGAGGRARIRELHDLYAGLARRRSRPSSLVTVVIPAYEHVDATLSCLRSIAINWPDRIAPTITVIDDASPDGSARYLAGIPGVDLLCNGSNLGYLHSSNRGAALAQTKYVHFLNNDVEVRSGWLDWLVTCAEEDPSVGAVGSKLIYPDGRLQEAGSIIWSDGTGWNYGRGADPANSRYNFAREVDYCSAASLLVRRDLLRQLGGFDPRYAPAYYEDADLCFEIRRLGSRVVYEPRSEVTHFEGMSSGTDIAAGVKRYQEINRAKFSAKWQAELQRQYAPSAANVERARERRPVHATILIVDSYVPMYDREAGSNRLFKLVEIFVALGFHVIFLPDNFAFIEPYTSALGRLGVEVLHELSALKPVLPDISLAWICRPELCLKYIPLVRKYSTATIVYDTIDLHFVRERRRAELEGLDGERWQTYKRLELTCARAADATITVSDVEREELRGFGILDVFVIPTIHDATPDPGLDFVARHGVLFIGGYNHTPNVDAARWLCQEIMPRVWQSLPDVTVTLLGSSPPQCVMDLRSERVLVTGFIPDVAPFFESARVFVAPLRYGAGMKGKVGQALSYGLPIVTTSIGAEGFDLRDGVNCTLANDTESFAAAIVDLYEDPGRRRRYAAAAQAVTRGLGSEAVRASVASVIAQIETSRNAVRG